MRKQRTYNIDGTWWIQRELKYKHFLQVLELLDGQLTDFLGDQIALGELLDRLKKDRTLQKIGAVLLQPHPGTTRRLQTRWRQRRDPVPTEFIIEEMTTAQAVGVLLDFFTLNITSIMESGISSGGSFTSRVMAAAMTALRPGKNPSTTSEAEIPAEQTTPASST